MPTPVSFGAMQHDTFRSFADQCQLRIALIPFVVEPQKVQA
jgi:hypothetical protein